MFDQSWSLELIVKYIEHSLIEPFLNLYKFALQTVYINQSINQSFILTRCVKELKNLFKIRTCINKIYNNYNYIILFNFKNNSINRYRKKFGIKNIKDKKLRPT